MHHSVAPITSLTRRVWTLFRAGANTTDVAAQISVELRREVPEHEVYHALARAQNAHASGEFFWPHKRMSR